MPLFESREASDGLVVTIDSPVALNDFRSNTFRRSSTRPSNRGPTPGS